MRIALLILAVYCAACVAGVHLIRKAFGGVPPEECR